MGLSRPSIGLCRIAALVAVALAAGVAGAAPPPTEADLTQARERFGAARKLEDTGRWSEALELLQRVAEVKTTPQVRFHIALCMENIGLWTQALDGYAQALAEARDTAPDVMKEAGEHLHYLEGTIPTVSVLVRGAASGDQLFLDRRALPIDDRPLAIRADPGAHTAEVHRGDSVAARQYFVLDPKSTRRIELQVGEVAAAPPPEWKPPPPPINTAPPVAPLAPPPVAPPPEKPARDGSLQRTLGWSAVGLAGASAILTGVFVGLRAGALGDLDTTCPTRLACPSSVHSTVDDGKTYAALVNVFAVVGGAAAVGGAALLLTAPSSSAPPAAPRAGLSIAPVLGPGAAGLAVQGTF